MTAGPGQLPGEIAPNFSPKRALKGLGDAGSQEHDAAEIGAPAFAGEAQEVARTLVQRGGLADAARSSCGRPNGRHAWHAAGSAAHRCQKAAARPIGCE